MITIIDYGVGNLSSVEKACAFLGLETEVTSNRKSIAQAKKIILPGVGSCLDAMNQLKKLDLIDIIREKIEENTPFLGICLGMQMLFEYSEEGDTKCLGILKGRIRKIPSGQLKVPQMGWNSIRYSEHSRLFQGVEQDSYFYFVHSYYAHGEDRGQIAATTEYGVTIDTAVEDRNLFATQFHPEKSGETGLKLLKNFSEVSI